MLLGPTLAAPTTWQVGYHCPEGTAMVGLEVNDGTSTEGVQLVCRNMSNPSAPTMVASQPVSGIRQQLSKRTACYGSRSFVTSLRYAVSSLEMEDNTRHLNPVAYVALKCSGGEQLSLDISHALRVAEKRTVREAGCKAEDTAVIGWVVSHSPYSTADSNNASMRLLCDRLPAAATLPGLSDYDLPDTIWRSMHGPHPSAAFAAGDAATQVLYNEHGTSRASAQVKPQVMHASVDGKGAKETLSVDRLEPMIDDLDDLIEADEIEWFKSFAAHKQGQGEPAQASEVDEATLAALFDDYDDEAFGDEARRFFQPSLEEQHAQAVAEAAAASIERAAFIEYYDDWWGSVTGGKAANSNDAGREVAMRLAKAEAESHMKPEKVQAANAAGQEKKLSWADTISFHALLDVAAMGQDSTTADGHAQKQQSTGIEPPKNIDELAGWHRMSAQDREFASLLNHASHGYDAFMADADYYGDDAEYQTWLREVRQAAGLTLPPASSSASQAAAADAGSAASVLEEWMAHMAAGNWADYDYEAYYSDLAAISSSDTPGQPQRVGLGCAPDCAECDLLSGECFFCRKGFTLDLHKVACEACPFGCEDCSNVAEPSAQCNKCDVQHALDAETAACVPKGLTQGWQGSLAKGSDMERRSLEASLTPVACEYPCLTCDNGACAKCAMGHGLVGSKCVAFNITGAWQRHFYGFDGRKIDMLDFEAGSFYNLLSEAHHQVNVQFDGLVDEEGSAGAIALTRAVGLMYGPHKVRVELKIDNAGDMWTMVEVNGEQLTTLQDARRGVLNATLSLPDPWRLAVRASTLPAAAGSNKSAGEAVVLQTPLLGLTVTRSGRDLELHLVMHAAPGAGAQLHGVVGRTAQSAALAAAAADAYLRSIAAVPMTSYVLAGEYEVEGLFGADYSGSLFRPVDGPLARQDHGVLANILDTVFKSGLF